MLRMPQKLEHTSFRQLIVTLVVPSVQRSTLSDRAFPVAASRAWHNWRHICLGSVLANFLLPSSLLTMTLQGRLLHINDGANAPWKKYGGKRFCRNLGGSALIINALSLSSW